MTPRKASKGRIFRASFSLLITLSLLAVLPPAASAHAPQSVSLEYDFAAQRLNVSIVHVVADNTTHYVKTVEVKRNGVVNMTINYTSQPSLDNFNYTYDINATDGDVIEVTATCVLFGSTTRQLTVSSTPPDFLPPAVQILSPTNGQVFNTSVINVSGNASDNVAVKLVEVSNNNGTWQNATGTTNWSTTVTLTLGTNFIRARAFDTSNNTNLDFVYITYSNITPPGPDTTLPNITISYPADAQIFNVSNIAVRGNASDPVGIRVVQVKLDNGPWSNATGNTTWNATVNLPEGSHTITARAVDKSNNTNSTSVSVTYQNQTQPPPTDTTPPSITISSPVNNDLFENSTINVSGTASDNIALQKVEVRVNKGSWHSASGTGSWRATVNLVNGTNTIDARATDTSSNQAEVSVNVTYIAPPPPDHVPPTLTVLSPTDNSFFTTSSLTVSGTATDNVGVDMVQGRLNSGSWRAAGGSTSWSISFTLVEGSNTIDIRAGDAAGNTANASITVTYLKVATGATLDGIVNPGEYKFTDTFGDGDYLLSWSVKGKEIWMAIQGRTRGWVAIGLAPEGPMMKGADMVIGWCSGNKAGMVDAYAPSETGDHPADAQMTPAGTSDILAYGCSESGGITTFEFKRLFKTGDRWDKEIPTNGKLKFLWALGPDDNPSSKHSKVGYGTIDIVSGASTETQAMQWQPHAVLMVTGMTLLIIGVLAAMSRPRGWLKFHKAMGWLGALISACGLIYGVYMIQVSSGKHFRVLHTIVGILTLFLVTLQPVLGARMRALKKQGAGRRPVHRWLGRIAILMMLLTVIMGLLQAGVIKA